MKMKIMTMINTSVGSLRGRLVEVGIPGMHRRALALATLAFFSVLDAAPGKAAAAGVPAEESLAEVTITAAKLRPLDAVTPTGSRLGLSVQETPGTIDVIDSDQMLGRGYSTLEHATASMAGIITGGSPGDLADFSMRGFSGEQVVMLRDGLYLGPSNMTNRPANTFNLERVEVLKGPASVLYGQGPVGGAVNAVSKRARIGERRIDYAASGGRFGTLNLGLGAALPLGERVALRIDASHTRNTGYVQGAGADSSNLTASLLWQRDAVGVEFYIDVLDDHPSDYFGTPLLPVAFATQPLAGVIDSDNGLTIDRRTRYLSYNVSDSRVHSRQYWPQLKVDWRISDKLELRNIAYYFDAERTWINSEIYAFNSVDARIDRDRFFVLHDQQLFGDQFSAIMNGQMFGRPSRTVVGIDFSHLDFLRTRGFPDGDSVDVFNPVPGVFGQLNSRRQSPTSWDSLAVFMENISELTARTRLVIGARYDDLNLVRANLLDGIAQPSGFKRSLGGSNWRVGVVHDTAPGLTSYVSFTTGKAPVGDNIFLVNANQRFKLSDARQFEAGLKYASPSGRADATAAVYDIQRSNLLTQINSSGDVANVGSQKSHGVELALNLRPLQSWSISTNLAYTAARYGEFFDPNFGIDASGNRTPNAPRWVANLWSSLRNVGGTGLELGGGLRFVGDRYGDSANQLGLRSYALADVYANYRVNPRLMLTSRISNLFNKAYAQWADIFYPTEVLLGSPRRFEIGAVGTL
jgi:iron complex outermembrane recepter protein